MSLERALTEARLPKLVELAEACARKKEVMLLYTQFIGGGIRQLLRDALQASNLKVTFFTVGERRLTPA